MLVRRVACVVGGCLAGAGFGLLINALLSSITTWLIDGTNLLNGEGYPLPASSGVVWASTLAGAGVGLIIGARLRGHPNSTPGRMTSWDPPASDESQGQTPDLSDYR